MEAATLQKISSDLDFLKREVVEIRARMIDVDSLLTPAEEQELEASIANYKNGTTIGLEKLRKDLNL